MIISRTPFRISLFGGGTDYPDWYLRHGGSVLGATIDKYCYLSVRRLPPFFQHKHRVVYSKIELTDEIEEIEHPAVRAVMREMRVRDGLAIHHDGDLPARSGLGSSSSFTVGLLNTLYALRGQAVGCRKLAEEGIRIEQKVIGEAVGSQDQIWAAYGGINRIKFRQDGSFDVQPLIVDARRRKHLNEHLMLFFTGLSRQASEIAQDKIRNFEGRRSQLRALGAMVDEAAEIIQDRNADIREIGVLLNEGWRLKKELSERVTTSAIDKIYDSGIESGALGGKLLGAGGGGFLLLFVEPSKQVAVRERLSGLTRVSFEIGSPGSRIVVYEPNGLDAP